MKDIGTDSICLISEGAGMLIGPSSSSMGLVHGEVIEFEFVPSRPCLGSLLGPPHSHILLADGKTKYLSESKFWHDSVTLVSENGSTRSANIGRLKIGKRPFLRIYWGNDYQNIRTRIFSSTGGDSCVSRLELAW